MAKSLPPVILEISRTVVMVREIEVIDAAPEFELCFRLLSKQIGAIFERKFIKITDLARSTN